MHILMLYYQWYFILGNKYNDIEKLIKHGIEDCMRLDCRDTPLLISQNALIGYDQKSQQNVWIYI